MRRLQRRFLVLAALLAVGTLIAACSGGDKSADGLVLADRWLRVGEDINANVHVYNRALPPDLSDLLNPDPVVAGSKPVALPVYADATLLGSYHLRRGDGSNILWLIYDVEGDSAAVTKTVREQLDQSPWQVVGGQGNESLDIVRFQNTGTGDLQGSAVVQENPSSSDFKLVVMRGDREVTLTVPRAAPVPVLTATLGTDLSVQRVDVSPERSAGLQVGDRITHVNDTAVTSQATLDQALYALSGGGHRSTSITYVLQIQPPVAPRPATFVEPLTPLVLPADFPASDAWSGLTVLNFTWANQGGTKAYQATMVSKDGSGTVASAVRTGLAASGWQITSDTASGIATTLAISNDTLGQSGQVTIDAFPSDAAYVEVDVQVQTRTAAPAAPSGTPGATPGN